MHRRPLVTLAAGAVLLLAAVLRRAGHDRAVDGKLGRTKCRGESGRRRRPMRQSAAAGEVSVSIENFTFNRRHHGRGRQTITFTNGDRPRTRRPSTWVPTPNIGNGASDG
jgi:hypothetical protein